MRLFRLCSKEEIEAIKNDGVDRLKFGRCLFSFINFDKEGEFCNNYKVFNDLYHNIRSKSDEEKIHAILKVFPNVPSEIPILEKNVAKRLDAFSQYVPDRSKYGHIKSVFYNSENIFLATIRLACCFENLYKIENGIYNYQHSTKNILELEVPRKVVMQYKGKGNYDVEYYNYERSVNFNEFAVPLYMIGKENVVSDFEIYDDRWQELKEKYYKKGCSKDKNDEWQERNKKYYQARLQKLIEK